MNIKYRIGEDGKGHVFYNGERVKPGFSFTGAMRTAHDDGSKTKTRRVIKGQESWWKYVGPHPNGGWWASDAPLDNSRAKDTGFKAKAEVGQLVYVKEALYKGETQFGKFIAAYSYNDCPVVTPAIETIPWHWQRDRLPAMFMPGIAARRIDRIVSVKAERLQDIDYGDYPDFCDAYIASADYRGRPMTEEEVEWLDENETDFKSLQSITTSMDW